METYEQTKVENKQQDRQKKFDEYKRLRRRISSFNYITFGKTELCKLVGKSFIRFYNGKSTKERMQYIHEKTGGMVQIRKQDSLLTNGPVEILDYHIGICKRILQILDQVEEQGAYKWDNWDKHSRDVADSIISAGDMYRLDFEKNYGIAECKTTLAYTVKYFKNKYKDMQNRVMVKEKVKPKPEYACYNSALTPRVNMKQIDKDLDRLYKEHKFTETQIRNLKHIRYLFYGSRMTAEKFIRERIGEDVIINSFDGYSAYDFMTDEELKIHFDISKEMYDWILNSERYKIDLSKFYTDADKKMRKIVKKYSADILDTYEETPHDYFGKDYYVNHGMDPVDFAPGVQTSFLPKVYYR